jgi:hypothetical protein
VYVQLANEMSSFDESLKLAGILLEPCHIFLKRLAANEPNYTLYFNALGVF